VSDCYYELLDADEPVGERFAATDLVRSTWSASIQHGAPPSALLVRALERCEQRDDTRLSRVLIDLLGPVPAEGEEVPQYADLQSPTPEQTAVRHELRHCLERTLAELDTTGRAVITLRDIEDRPYQELAEMLGLGLSAVKMRIHRARLAFQQLLARICPDAWQAEIQI
jgi:RNA polymerase sigma factor (sigma-70 family)